jgi:hypothetical protein
MRTLLHAGVVALLLATPVLAQNNLLDDARRRQEIANQKADVDVKAALKEASAARPAEALVILKKALDRVQNDVDISTTRQENMVRTLKDRIRITEISAKMTTDQALADAQKNAKANARAADVEKQKAEREKIRTAINEIVQLQGKGMNAEADRKAKDLAAQYPDNPAAKAMGTNGYLNARIRESRDMLTDMERRSIGTMNDLAKTSTMPVGDVEFDKKRWGEITKARKGEPLSEKEKALLAALNKMLKPGFRNTKFEDVMDQISQFTGVTIILDKGALEAANITPETLITFAPPNDVSVRTVLRKVLRDNDLTYVVKDESIYVTSVERAKAFMTTKAYYVGDLTVGLGAFGNSIQNAQMLQGFQVINVNGQLMIGNPAQLGIYLSAQQELENAEIIRKLIIDSVDPQSWKENGGAGSIAYDRITKSFIVRQSAEIQSLMRGSLLK